MNLTLAQLKALPVGTYVGRDPAEYNRPKTQTWIWCKVGVDAWMRVCWQYSDGRTVPASGLNYHPEVQGTSSIWYPYMIVYPKPWGVTCQNTA